MTPHRPRGWPARTRAGWARPSRGTVIAGLLVLLGLVSGMVISGPEEVLFHICASVATVGLAAAWVRRRPRGVVPSEVHERSALSSVDADLPSYDALLVTRSCTTGWFDWIHGELWLLPGALVRVRTSLVQSVANSHGPMRTVRRVDPGDPSFTPHQVLAGSRRNRYVILDDIASARLRPGWMNGRLDLTMRDGTRYTFLWLAGDPAYQVLRSQLPRRLPSQVEIR